MCGAQHVTNFVLCAPHDPKPHLILRTINQTMNTHQGAYVDGTATTLTAHQWFQKFCLFSAQIELHKVTSSCFVALIGVTALYLLKWSETKKTKNEEQTWNATGRSPSASRHTIFEGLFQQLSTTFVAAAGKKHWSNTSQMD